MITIYTTPSCQSCKKAVTWLVDNKINFKEKNIFASVLHREEFSKILDASEEGFESIISKRSEFMKTTKINFDDLTFNDAQRILIENPSAIRRPIILDDKTGNLQIGFNKSDMGIFRNGKNIIECPTNEGDKCPCDGHVHSDVYRQLRAKELEAKDDNSSEE